jgi:glycogen debranching enzyme-like protein
MGASVGGADGLFDHDTRYLSRLELLNGTHGDAKPPDVLRALADCQKARSASVYDRHGAYERPLPPTRE